MATADRVERLTNLLALLLETTKPLTLVEIAGELEGQYPEKGTTRRAAFERDKSALREIGVPIESVVLAGDQAGMTAYWIDRHRYELGDLDLDPDEMRALQVAVAAVRPARGREALWKLGLDADERDVAVSAMVPELAGLPVLREASAGRATVEFDYRGTPRRLDPYGLLLRGGFWYVVGHDHTHDELRTYRVDRIAGDVSGGRIRGVRPAEGIRPSCGVPRRPEAARGRRRRGRRGRRSRRRRSRRRRRARARSGPRDGRRLDDGSVEVAVPCANLPAFRSWVLGLLDHAEVVSPPEVRQAIVSWLQQLAGTA